MASGKTHDWVTLALMPPTLWVCRTWLDWPWSVCFWILLGVFIGGFYLSPDLDIKSRPFYRWGPLRFIWRPYQWCVKHRSGWSHGVLLAAWFRLLYLAAALLLLAQGTSWLVARLTHSLPYAPHREAFGFAQRHLNDFLWTGAGVWLGCLFHIALDHLSSAWPFRRKRR